MKLESVMVALFAKLEEMKAEGDFRNVSRKLEHVNDYDITNMPAAFQHQENVQVTSVRTGPLPKNRFAVEWYLYVPGNADGVHSPVLNVLLEKMAEKLKPDHYDNRCTLNGLVENVYIEGTIEMYEGVMHDRAVAIVPIVVVLPGF